MGVGYRAIHGRRERPPESAPADGPRRGADHRRARVRAALVATGAAVLVYLVAAGIELLVIARLRPTETELTWIGDAILAVALGFAVFLWLDLRWTRMTLSRLEREQVVLDTQLSVTADIQRGLLPALPADGGCVRWAARLVPAGRIGGDSTTSFEWPEAPGWCSSEMCRARACRPPCSSRRSAQCSG